MPTTWSILSTILGVLPWANAAEPKAAAGEQGIIERIEALGQPGRKRDARADAALSADIERSARQVKEALKKLPAGYAALHAKKKADRAAFEAAGKALHSTFGRSRRDDDALATCSTIEDEGRRKELRERILRRYSDEAFSDFQKVNEIILFNRREPK